MDRRNALKNMIVASGSLIALPTWANGWSVDDVRVLNGFVSIDQQEVLSAVADTIIPAGNSIGALSVGVDKFLLKLIADCYDKEMQENVKVQLMALDTSAQNTFQKSFAACDQLQRQNILSKLSTSASKDEKDFFNLMKSETIRGFNTSKEVMVTYLKYKMAPGHYYGCVDVKI